MAIILLLLLNLTILFLTFFSLRDKSLSVLFWISILIFFNLPHTIEVVSNLNSHKEDVLNEASFFALSFNTIFLVLTIISDLRFESNNYISYKFEESIVNKRFHVFQLFLLILSLLIWSFGLYQVSGNMLGASWTEMRSVDSIYSVVGNYLFLSSIGCVFVFYYTKNKGLLIFSLIISLLFILTIKSRSNIIPLITPFFIYLLYQKRLNLKLYLKSFLIGLLMIFLVFFLQQYRYLGEINNLEITQLVDTAQDTVENITAGEGEFNLINGFYFFIENNNSFNNFNEGITYKRLFWLPLPSSIFEFKPHDFAFDMYNALYPHRAYQGGTYHPIFYGDAYGNFGFFGFVLAFFWFIFFKIIDWMVNFFNFSISISLLAPISLMYILLARGAVYNAIAFLFWSMVIILIINLVSKLRWV